MRWEFQLLGGLSARCGGQEVASFSSGKGRAVLGMLLLHPGRRLARAAVAREFWPESDDGPARNSLTTELSNLRRDLRHGVIDVQALLPPGQREVWIAADLLRTDLQEFDRAVREFDALGRRGEPAELTLARLRLCRGDLLPAIEGAWLTKRRDEVRQAWLRLAAAAATGLRAAGRRGAAVALAHQAVEYYPLDEPALRFAMRLLGDLGETVAALRHHERLRERLHLSFGLALTPETAALAAQLCAALTATAAAGHRAEELAAAATQQLARGALQTAASGWRQALAAGLRGAPAELAQRQLQAVERALPRLVWEHPGAGPVTDGLVRRDGLLLLCHPAGGWSCWQTGAAAPLAQGRCGRGGLRGAWLGRTAEVVLAADSGELHWQSLVAGQQRGTAHLPGRVLALAVSPDRRWAAVGLERHGVAIWDLAHDDLVELPGTSRGDCLAWSPDGTLLAAGALSGELTIWEVGSWLVVWQAPQPGAVRALAWSPDGTQLASAGGDHAARVWQRRDLLAPPQVLRHGDRAVQALTWLAHGAWLVSVAGDGVVRGWRSPWQAGAAATVALGGDLQRVWGHPDGHQAVVLASHGAAFLVDLTVTNPEPRPEPIGTAIALAGTVGTDGNLLLVDRAGHLRQFDLATGAPDGALLHAGGCHVARAVWSPDQQRLATAGNDGGLRVWTAAGRLRRAWQLEEAIREVVWDPTGGLLALTAEGCLAVFAADGHRRDVHLPGAPMRHLAVLAEAGLVLAASGDLVRWWLWPTLRLAGELVVPGHCRAVAASPDGNVLYIAELGGRVTAHRRGGDLLWEQELDRPLWRLALAGPALLAAGSSPAVLLEASSGELLGPGWEHAGECHHLAHDLTRRLAALSTTAGPVQVVDLTAPHQPAVVLERHRWGLWSAFTPHGTVVAAGDDGEVREFCAVTGSLVAPPRQVPGLIPHLTLRAADGWLTATCGDGRVYGWAAPANEAAKPAAPAPTTNSVAGRAVWHESAAVRCAQAGQPDAAWWHWRRAWRDQPDDAWSCWQAALAAWAADRHARVAALLSRAARLTSDPRPAADALLWRAWRDGPDAARPAAAQLVATLVAAGRSPLVWQVLPRVLVVAAWSDLLSAVPEALLHVAPTLASAARLEVLAAWRLRRQQEEQALALIDQCWAQPRHQRSLWATAVRAAALQRLGHPAAATAAAQARRLALAAEEPHQPWPRPLEAAFWLGELSLAEA